MLNRLFFEHPRSVDESYLQHLRTASWFGVTMIGAGLACMVHAAVPAFFVKTGSQAITDLHDRMVHNRIRASVTTVGANKST